MNDTTRHNRHGERPLQTNRYSEQVILEMNLEHDRKMGWSKDSPTIYQNVSRRPEAYFGSIKDLWSNRVDKPKTLTDHGSFMG